MQVCQADPTMS